MTSEVGSSRVEPASEPGRSGFERDVGGWRARVRRAPGGTQLLQVGVFLAGLVCILIGCVLIIAPGPLTIPPILLGVWIWSTEFRWADRWLVKAKASAREAWRIAKAKPVHSALVTGTGLVALGVGLYLVVHYQLVDKLTSAVGLG